MHILYCTQNQRKNFRTVQYPDGGTLSHDRGMHLNNGTPMEVPYLDLDAYPDREQAGNSAVLLHGYVKYLGASFRTFNLNLTLENLCGGTQDLAMGASKSKLGKAKIFL